MPGDVLDLRILEIDFAVPYGFNAQRPYGEIKKKAHVIYPNVAECWRPPAVSSSPG